MDLREIGCERCWIRPG